MTHLDLFEAWTCFKYIKIPLLNKFKEKLKNIFLEVKTYQWDENEIYYFLL